MSTAIDETQARIIEEFSALDDSLDRYERLIDLGRRHDPPDEQLRSAEHAIPGCQSQVWIRAEVRDGRLHLHADSDSLIIRGVLALLLRVLDGRRPAEVAAADLHFLEEVGLTTHLSPSRANGVATIVRHLQRSAAELGE
ncbi:MAG: SufE family protein [Planctomycetota bacterium]|nr:SufE family protein [Planctomycetota bacterium]